MAVKFYAVKVGHIPGIYKTWDACKKQVDGFSGAIYKSFKTLAEAECFMGGSVESTAEIRSEDSLEPKNEEGLIAYVDGSYNIATGEFSYGAVLIHEDQEVHLSQKVEDSELALMRNVAGEIKGAEAAMQYALDHKIRKVTIYHDYEGIARWCQGDWKANKEGTIAYRDFYIEASKQLNISFIKVKGHSNDHYNDLADALAKQAIFS